MHRAGFFVKSRALSEDMVAVMQVRPGVCQQRAQPLLALDQRPWPEILAVEVEKSKRKNTRAAALPLSDARRAQQQVINAQSGVAGERVPEIFPEGADPLPRVERPQRVGPALRDQAAIGLAHLRPE
jgi:hypothetical protein